MSYSFVDRIIELEEGKRIVGLKKITHQDLYFYKNDKGKTVLEPLIMGEALGQLLAWNVIKSSQFQFRILGGILHEALNLNDAFIGETILLEGNIDLLDYENKVVVYDAVASIHKKPIFKISCLSPLIDLNYLNDVNEIQREFQKIYQPCSIENCELHMEDSDLDTSYDQYFEVDTILEWKKGSYLIAEKILSPLSPYFSNHFPKRVVLPLTVLLGCNTKLAIHLLSDFLNEHKSKIKFKKITKAKINQFIIPCDTLKSKIIYKGNEKNRFFCDFYNEVKGNKICVGSAEFLIGQI